jgi:hypothetical protein
MSRCPWRIQTLFEHFTGRLVEMDLRHQQRFDAQTKAIEAALTAQRTAVEAALVAADKATNKAEEAASKRFDSVNEFRAALSDQAANFITRMEAEASIRRNTERVQEVATRLQDIATKAEVIAAHRGLSERLDLLAERVTRSEGRGTGLAAGWGYIATLFGVVATFVAAYFAIRG